MSTYFSIRHADPTALHYKCPFCGNEFFNQGIKAQKQDAYVFPVTIDSQDFMQNVKDVLKSEEDIPLDFIEPKIFSSHKLGLYYVPFYVFTGLLHSSWSCDFVTQVERERTKYNGERQTFFEKRYTPGSGNPTDKYRQLSVGFSIKDEKLSNLLFHNTSGILGSLGKAKPAGAETLVGKVIPTADKETVWNSVEGILRDQGDRLCRLQASQHNGDISGFSSTTSVERKEERLYYLPVYILEVEYEGGTYYIMQDAANAFIETKLPKDQEYIGRKNELENTKNKNLKSDPSSAFGPLAFLLGYGIIALFGGSLLWKIIIGIVLWGILILLEESRYKASHIIVVVAFFIPFVIFQLIDIHDGFWAFVCDFVVPLVISEIPALSYTAKENEKNEAHNKIVTDDFNKAMSSLTNDRANKRRLRIESL